MSDRDTNRNSSPFIATTFVCIFVAVNPILFCDADAPEASNVFEFYLRENTTQGVLSGCELVYKVIGVDDFYRPGATIALSGSVDVFQPRSNVFTLSFKVCGYDDEKDGFRQFKVAYAFPIFDGQSLANAEDKHGIFKQCSHQLFFNDNLVRFIKPLSAADMKIAYSREIGKQDVIVPLHFSIQNLASASQASADFSRCVVRLISQVNPNPE